MFREIHASDYAFEQARLGFVHLRSMFRDVSLRFHEKERPARELLSNVLGAFGAKRGGVIERSVHNDLVQSTRTRETEWMQYAETTDERLADAASIVEASSAAWTEEQSRFRELADAIRAVRAMIESQAGSLSNV